MSLQRVVLARGHRVGPVDEDLSGKQPKEEKGLNRGMKKLSRRTLGEGLVA